MTEARTLDWRISNALEPFGSLPKPTFSRMSSGCCWQCVNAGPWRDDGSSIVPWHWSELDWLAPANNWRLIVELRQDKTWIVKIHDHLISLDRRDGNEQAWIPADNEHFAEAVREAFARVKGIA